MPWGLKGLSKEQRQAIFFFFLQNKHIVLHDQGFQLQTLEILSVFNLNAPVGAGIGQIHRTSMSAVPGPCVTGDKQLFFFFFHPGSSWHIWTLILGSLPAFEDDQAAVC